jgi:hypothetical protein
MWFALHMVTHDNDDTDPWTSLSLAAALILNRLQTKQILQQIAEAPDRDGSAQTRRELFRGVVPVERRGDYRDDHDARVDHRSAPPPANENPHQRPERRSETGDESCNRQRIENISDSAA